jgi:23S rRNA pseudouridine1911/1915/1917 synthase
MLEYKSKPVDAGSRLDILVAKLYPEFTRSSLELLFDKSLVSVNQKPAKASYKVKADDEIAVDETYLKNEPQEIELTVIYEDDDVTVIDKPAGVLTHSKGALNLEPTVASFMKDRLNDETLTDNRAGIVHRLDRGTSGVIITAKNSKALHHLQKQFSQRKVKKAYIAVAEGLLDPKEAIIDAPIGRNPRKPQTFKVMPEGRPAVTKYSVTNEFKKNGKNYSKLVLEPLTGRTHQLRVHLAYIGHPIVGDYVYGNDGGAMMLHAASLELTLPNKTRKTFDSPLPDRFKEMSGDE